jgi:hypothetical protein
MVATIYKQSDDKERFVFCGDLYNFTIHHRIRPKVIKEVVLPYVGNNNNNIAM